MRSRLIAIGYLSLVLASCAMPPGSHSWIPTLQEANDAVLRRQEHGSWAWALGIVLLWADLVLPIPQTAVITALGIIYGTLLGGLLGSLGLITGGLLGYGLMRTAARRLVQRFAGPRSMTKMESLFDRGGGWAIVLTRSLPYSVPEAGVFLAGMAGMPIRKFAAALAIGSVPTAFAFAAIGHGWADQPILALTVSYVLPIVLLRRAALVRQPGSRKRLGLGSTTGKRTSAGRASTPSMPSPHSTSSCRSYSVARRPPHGSPGTIGCPCCGALRLARPDCLSARPPIGRGPRAPPVPSPIAAAWATASRTC
jgi:uncharacterized membrane protein YdjX (TVP38/TMEM64 family)